MPLKQGGMPTPDGKPTFSRSSFRFEPILIYCKKEDWKFAFATAWVLKLCTIAYDNHHGQKDNGS
jgi:hypothetical protein